ncbi:MAG TPA: DUF4959 domain-containing protein [Bacteroidales bacterium]|nr:DUF4959 domain-containing protein [Bacteroidales bacterium]
MKMKALSKHIKLLTGNTFIAVSGVIIAGFLLSACENKKDIDTVPPGDVSAVKVEPTHGGGIISYKIPGDNDLNYIKAAYKNSLGNEVFRVSSHYKDSIEVDGFNDTVGHKVMLYAVDRNDNQSKGVEINFSPLISYIHLVKRSINLQPDLGGVKISWENIARKQVFVHLFYPSEGAVEERILPSQRTDEAYNIRGLDSLLYDFSVMVEDLEGNKTDTVFAGRVKPLYEEKIDKASWTLVSSLSVDGNAWEGLTVNFWDDVIDTKDSPSDNSYFIINRDNNGGSLNYPLDIVIDLNKKIILNRFKVWQRAYAYSDAESNGVSTNYYYYQGENMRSFELWTSNDKTVWTLLGSFDIGDPKDEDGNIPAAKIQEAIDGHEFSLENTSEPFRYLKFSLTSSFGSETNVYGSEITLFGLDNLPIDKK